MGFSCTFLLLRHYAAVEIYPNAGKTAIIAHVGTKDVHHFYTINHDNCFSYIHCVRIFLVRILIPVEVSFRLLSKRPINAINNPPFQLSNTMALAGCFLSGLIGI